MYERALFYFLLARLMPYLSVYFIRDCRYFMSCVILAMKDEALPLGECCVVAPLYPMCSHLSFFLSVQFLLYSCMVIPHRPHSPLQPPPIYVKINPPTSQKAREGSEEHIRQDNRSRWRNETRKVQPFSRPKRFLFACQNSSYQKIQKRGRTP